MINPKLVRRRPVQVRQSKLNVVVFQVDETFPPRLHSELSEAGANLMEISVPLLGCTDRELIREKVKAATSGVERVDILLAFAEYFGNRGGLANSSVGHSRQTFTANVLSLKVLFDELFKEVQDVKQICVLTVNPKFVGDYSSFGIAEAGLEMMVKLYAQERPSTHFSVIAGDSPGGLRPVAGKIAATIDNVSRLPSGSVVDESGELLVRKGNEYATR